MWKKKFVGKKKRMWKEKVKVVMKNVKKSGDWKGRMWKEKVKVEKEECEEKVKIEKEECEKRKWK